MTLDQLSNLIKDPKLFGILIVRPFGLLLQWLYSIVQNYGIAVILFALLVKLVCIPLTIKSKKSMLAMSAMNAELQQLQKKYANNRVKLNEEMQKLYEKHGVSPMSGCLPNLIPLPIMMGLYYAVQQPLQYIVGADDRSGSACGRKLHRSDQDRRETERFRGRKRPFLGCCYQLPAERRDHFPAGFPLLWSESG